MKKQQECCFVLILSFSFLMSFGAGVETPAPFSLKQKDPPETERSFCY